ncbi:MAG: response regulator [Desulfobacterales bacterium]
MDERLRLLLIDRMLETASHGAAFADGEGVLREWNSAFSRIAGEPGDQAAPRRMAELVAAEERAAFEGRLAELAASGRAAGVFETALEGPDGRRRPVTLAVAVERAPGGPPRAFGFLLTDRSAEAEAEEERRRLALHMQQAQKMEAIGTLAGGVAHDFNNLLMGIQGNLSLLRLNKEKGHPDLPYLQKIETAVERAAELTRQILGFARGGKYDVRVTDLNRLVAQTVDLFGKTRKELEIRKRLAADLRPIEADQTQIQQVLLNLLVNAWQAMERGGVLEVATDNVDVAANDPERPPDAPPGPYVRLEVRDSGEGMEEAVRKRIFEPFFSTRSRAEAKGLGLSAAWGIVRGHNGFITVESRRGEGSTFRVFLPAQAARAAASPPAPPASAPPRAVLLVEDEEIVCDIGEKMLRRLGFEVLTARSGEEAIRLYAARHGEIDLVILDLIMPGLTGAEVFERLRAIRPEVAVLLSSGFSLNGEAMELLRRGCRGFIQKPFSLEQLRAKIREITAAP